MTIATCPVRSFAETTPDAPFLQGQFSYREADLEIQRAVNALASLGLQRGDRLAVQGVLQPQTLLLLFAALRQRLSFVPISTRATAAEIRHCLQRSSARALITDEPVEGIEVRSQRFESLWQHNETHTTEALIDSEAEATLVFTSGSRGVPKGVPLRIENHFASAKAVSKALGFGAESCWLLCLPIFHVSGLSIAFRTALHGASCQLVRSGESLATALNLKHATHISLVPTVLSDLLDTAPHSLSNLQTILLGGAGVTSALRERIRQHRLPCFVSYGMTETASAVAIGSVAELADQASGYFLPHCSWRVMENGVLALKGSSLFSGYLDSTAPDRKTADGFFITGDTAQVDRNGCLSILGRVDDMFVSGGENIYGSEIEQAALDTGLVAEACVVVIDHQRWGKRPVLFVVLNPGQQQADVERALAGKLSPIKLPDRMLVLDSIPKTSLGKPDFPRLRALL